MFATAAMRPTRLLLLLVVAAIWLSGCSLLYPGSWAPVDEGTPQEVGRYTSGSATMTLSGGMDEEVSLELVAGSNTMTQLGTQLQWRTQGWVLALSGYTEEPETTFGSLGSLQIDRLSVATHWQANDWERRCDVDFDQLDESAVSGTASCQGLVWMDAVMGPMDFDTSAPDGIEDAEPIDVEIVFEARR